MEKKFAEVVVKRNLIKPGWRLLIAASGGPDSSALCLLIWRHRSLFKLSGAEMIYFNHGARPFFEIKKDIAAVKKLSSLTGFPCRFVKLKIPQKGASFENKARVLRYKILTDIATKEGFNAILTAHTADDNAETIIMRLLRGSGVKGLGGILPVSGVPGRKNLYIVRPLIFFNKSELLNYLKRHKSFKPSVDSTNEDERFLRNAVRRRIIPILKKFNPRVVEHFNNLARAMKEISDYIESESERAYKNCVVSIVGKSRRFLDLERFFEYNIAIRRRILSKWMSEPNDFDAVDAVHSFFESCRPAAHRRKTAADFSKFSICGFKIIRKGNRAFLS